MKSYPTIDREYNRKEHIYAFDKLDGSNIRAEWSKKRGFYKFGTRNQLIDESSPFGKAIGLLKNKYETDLTSIFKEERWENVVCFFEFYGPNSFAGNHLPDEEQTVTLFDVSVHKKGLVGPKEFLDLFGNLDIPKLLYTGNANAEFVQAVHNSELEGITAEGVVCKGKYISPGMPLMFKVKTNAWIERLKTYCNNNKDLFVRLL